MALKLLDPQRLLDEAAASQGLTRYAESGIHERFAGFVRRLNEVAGGVPEDSYEAVSAQLRDMAVKRLKLARDWHEEPGILRQAVDKPFFVFGHLPYANSHVASLLTLDEGQRSPAFWEVNQPSPPPGSDPFADLMALEAANEKVDKIVESVPLLLSINPELDQAGMAAAEMDYMTALDFHTSHPLHLDKLPNPRPMYLPENPRQACSFHKKLLQQFQWRNPVTRWVCRARIERLEVASLLEVYPDALCLWVHSHPAEFVLNTLVARDLLLSSRKGGDYKIDPAFYVRELWERIDGLMASPWLDDPRIMHIHFDRFLEDPMEAIGESYRRNDIPFSVDYEWMIASWLETAASDPKRYGDFLPPLEKFGLDKQVIAETFRDYIARFGLEDNGLERKKRH
jgi:hypothetical protein